LPTATRIEEERELRRETRETSEMIATSSAWFVAGKGQGYDFFWVRWSFHRFSPMAHPRICSVVQISCVKKCVIQICDHIF
jgi:hypothetical protein